MRLPAHRHLTQLQPAILLAVLARIGIGTGLTMQSTLLAILTPPPL